MVDLPIVLEEKRKSEAARNVLNARIAAIPVMDAEAIQELMDGLLSQTGLTEEGADDGPDTEGLAKLKALLTK